MLVLRLLEHITDMCLKGQFVIFRAKLTPSCLLKRIPLKESPFEETKTEQYSSIVAGGGAHFRARKKYSKKSDSVYRNITKHMLV